MGTLAVEPMWGPLRGRPRFRAILDRLGLAPLPVWGGFPL